MAEILVDGWYHRYDLKATIAFELDKLLRYKHQGVEISVRRPTKEDGCWCFRYGRENTPHEHNPGLGLCPVKPYVSDSVYLKLEVS